MPWDSLVHRKADAFVDLARNFADVQTTKRAKPLIVVHTSSGRTAGEIDGIPIAGETLQELLPHARVIEQDDAPVVDYGDGRFAIPVALQRELARRDVHCRYPGCEHTHGLQHHHLEPVTWGGSTSRKLALRICPSRHRRIEPHGIERLVGDPDLPDGLRVVLVSESGESERDRAGLAP